MSRRPAIREVMTTLGVDATLTPEALERVRASVAAVDAGSPWYLRLLMGIGAWVGAWFMLAFVLGLIAIVLEDAVDGAAVVCGLGLVAGAVWLAWQRRQEFLQQVALVVSLTGQALVIGGIGSSSSSLPAAAFAGLLLSLALIAVFPDRIHRFLSTCGVVVALAAILFDARAPHGNEALVIGLIAIVLAVWRGAPLAWRVQYAQVVGPVASAAVVSIFGLLLVSSLLGFAELNPSTWLATGGPVTAAAVLGLIWLIQEVMDDHESGRFGNEGIVASAAVVALAAITWRTPAIVTTLLVLLLAFDRRSRTLLALAIAFFLAFGALYYYNLEMTLLRKSGVLAGSGALCLAIWFLVRRQSASEQPV
jgi:uncharacterized membrane protein